MTKNNSHYIHNADLAAIRKKLNYRVKVGLDALDKGDFDDRSIDDIVMAERSLKELEGYKDGEG